MREIRNERAERIGRDADRRLLITVEDTAAITGLGVRTLWRLVSAGEFPKPVRIPGLRAARWRCADVREWVDTLEDHT